MIEQSQAEFGVKSLCRVLKVSRSGYYAWLGAECSERQKADLVLKGRIHQIWESKRQSYGLSISRKRDAATGVTN